MKAITLVLVLVASVALAQSTPPKIFLPGHVSGLITNNTQGANVMFCATVPAEFSLSSLTKMAVTTAGGNAGLIVGVGVYPNSDGGTAVASFSHTMTGVESIASATGLTSFSVTGGTLYRVCTCGSVGNVGLVLGVQQATTCCEDETTVQLVQAFHPTYVGTAANTCTSGVPPATTGAITPDATTPARNTQRIPIVLLEQ